LEHLLVYLIFFIGLAMIVKCADWFVESAVLIAYKTGLPQVLMGSTLVSLATTLPELVVSSFASYNGHPGMAIGNAIGSTICNTGLILGSTAIIKPFYISRRFFVLKSLFMLAAAGFVFCASKDLTIGGKESVILLIMLIGYGVLNFYEIKTTKNRVEKPVASDDLTILTLIKFVSGALGVVLGAELVVNKGVVIANILGVPERVISLTMIALGTSLPEFITSITALIKGHQSISVGNILGANILNLLMVLGVASAISPLTMSRHAFVFDLPISIFMIILLLVMAFTDRKIERWEGFVLFAAYVFYLMSLALIFFD